MKRQIVMFALFLLAGFGFANAQGGGGGGFRMSIEERIKRVHDKIDSAFKLGPTKMADVDSAFANYYRAQSKIREDMMNGGGQPDRQAMMEKMKPVTDERDAKLKTILGDGNYKIWKEQIEPAMMPQRPPRGGNN